MDTLTTACRLVALIAMWDPYEYRDTTEGEENDILEMRRALNEGKTDKIVEKLKEIAEDDDPDEEILAKEAKDLLRLIAA